LDEAEAGVIDAAIADTAVLAKTGDLKGENHL
jgi:hypothetical protein